MAEEIQRWVFEPRQAVNPVATQSEWGWVKDWVKEQGLTGKVWAHRDADLDGENMRVSFTIYHGKPIKEDRDNRAL